jgi:hypothetical protein
MRNLLLAATVVIAGLCFANTAQAQWGCPPGYGGYAYGGYGYGAYGYGGAYYRAPINTYYRGYGYVPRVYTYSYGPGYYPYNAYYGRGGYYGGRGVPVRIGF